MKMLKIKEKKILKNNYKEIICLKLEILIVKML